MTSGVIRFTTRTRNKMKKLAIILVFCFCECTDDNATSPETPNNIFDDLDDVGSYETVGGIYQIWYKETSDDCHPDDELAEDLDLLWVLVKDDLNNGNHTVHMITGGGFEWLDMPISPEGNFVAEYYYYFDLYRDTIVGAFTLEETESGGTAVVVHATIWVDILDAGDHEPNCSAIYELAGFQMFQAAEPPVGMDY